MGIYLETALRLDPLHRASKDRPLYIILKSRYSTFFVWDVDFLGVFLLRFYSDTMNGIQDDVFALIDKIKMYYRSIGYMSFNFTKKQLIGEYFRIFA
ncbi:MAG TPA: hypothetical protein DCZ41_03565 [Firmicutes bacterium]|nr:hypothetical protein [Bacillota bacterium]